MENKQNKQNEQNEQNEQITYTRWVIAFRRRKNGQLRWHLAASVSGRKRRRRWRLSGHYFKPYRFIDLADARRAMKCSVVTDVLGQRDHRTGRPLFFIELVERVYGPRLFAKPLSQTVVKRVGLSPLEQLAMEAE